VLQVSAKFVQSSHRWPASWGRIAPNSGLCLLFAEVTNADSNAVSPLAKPEHQYVAHWLQIDWRIADGE
jgi:hypothetical protein